MTKDNVPTATSLPPPSSPPAGWYADPEREGQRRYWDGQTWTSDRHAAPVAQPPVVTPKKRSAQK